MKSWEWTHLWGKDWMRKGRKGEMRSVEVKGEVWRREGKGEEDRYGKD